jgi:hypothetical protein
MNAAGFMFMIPTRSSNESQNEGIMSISCYSVCSGLEITTKSLTVVNFIGTKLMSFLLSYALLFYFLHFNLSVSRIYVSIMFQVQLEVLQWDAERA